MKQFYKALFFVILSCNSLLSFAAETLPPSAFISGTTTVCQGAAAPQITFTGSGGTGPYVFVYKINGGSNLAIATSGASATVTVNAPTGVSGTFNYTLVSVDDAVSTPVPATGTATITVLASPVISGDISGCLGGTSQLTGSGVPAASNPWVSSNPAVATVSATGLVTSQSIGSTTITYTNNSSCQTSVTFTVGALPVVDFSFDNNNACSGTDVNFLSSVSGGTPPYTYEWTFGGGGSSTEAHPTHQFQALGCGSTNLQAILVVTDANGCSASAMHAITVLEKPHAALEDQNVFFPFSNCSNSPTILNPEYTITVNNISVNNPCTTEYTIDWGDGTVEENLTMANFPLTHTYMSLGRFELALTAHGTNGCDNTVIYDVANQSNPAGSLGTLGSTTNICAPDIVPFTIGNWEFNSPGTTYTLDFGDGSSVTLEHPLTDEIIYHTYTASSCPAASYTATLTVSNLCDATPYTAGNIQIRIQPEASFAIPVVGACEGEEVCFVNTTVVGSFGACNALTSYTWNFGDPASGASNVITGSSTANVDACHVFSGPGTYTVTLTTTNPCGTSSVSQQVCIDGAPEPSFTVDTSQGCGPLAVSATNTTDETTSCGIEYNWTVDYAATNCGTSPLYSFTGGTNATSFSPAFVFTNPGTYTIELAATNTCGTVTTTRQITVEAPPEVVIDDMPDACGATTVTINPVALVQNCGSDAVTYSWNFPGGTPSTSTDASPTVEYTTTGFHTFSVEVTNECGTVSDSETFEITPAVIADAGDDITICSGLGDTLSGSAAGGSGAGYTYLWTPADGLSDDTAQNPIATPDATTVYTLTVTDSNGCTATDDVTVFINTIIPGTIGTAHTLCEGGDPVALTEVTPAAAAGTIAYQWQSSEDDVTYTDIPAETGLTYDPPVLTATTYYRRVAISTLNGVECEAATPSLAISMNNVEAAVYDDATQTICVGGDLDAFTATTPASGSGTLTFLWESSADGIVWATAGTDETFDPPALTETTYYRQTVTSTLNGVPCSEAGDVIAITVIDGPEITADPLAAQSLCQGGTAETLEITASGGVGAYSYQWYVNTVNNNTTGTAIPGADEAEYLPPTDAVGTLYYYAIVSTPGLACNDTSAIAEVTVSPAPTFSVQPQPEALCIGETPEELSVAYTNGTGTPTYQWYSNTVNDTDGATAIPGAEAATYQPAATPVGITYYFATITFPVAGCSVITSEMAEVAIYELPLVAATIETETCSGTAFTVTPTDGGGNTIPPGTTYTWTAPSGTGFTGGSAQATPQTDVSQVLVNTTNAPVVATYTVTPSANGCAGTVFTVEVTVNPTPVIDDQTQTVCSDNIFTITPADNAPTVIVPAGTTYSWTAPVVTGGMTGGTAETEEASISGILINPTNTAQTATYTVTPISPAGDCEGIPFTVTITVDPVPSVLEQETAICSGDTFAITPVDGVDGVIPAGTQYTWTAPVIDPVGAITGASEQLTPQNNISQALANDTAAAATATYTVTPVSGGCTGEPFEVIVTVSPTPAIDDVTPQTLCNGEETADIVFTGPVAGTEYNWINDNPTIGLDAAGVGDIPAFTAVNNGTTPVTATITVTPSTAGCAGAPETFTITINPAPTVIFSGDDQAICSNTASEAITLTSNTPDSDITWTAVQPAGITGVVTSGTDTIPAQTLVNTTSGPIDINYIATAATTGVECPGPQVVYTITVNPVPFVAAPVTTDVCSGIPLDFIPDGTAPNNIPAGTTFTWTAPAGTGFTGGSAQAVPQTSLNQTLVNTTNAPVTATYTLTPEFGGCTGVPFTVTVTVNPTAVITGSAVTICNGGTFSVDPSENAANLPVGTTYSWSEPLVTGGITGGAPGAGEALVTGTLENPSAAPQTATYTVTPISPEGGCDGNTFEVVVTVNPQFDATAVVSDYNGFEISGSGATDGFINLTVTGGTGAYTFSWVGPDGFTADTEDINNLGEGTYTVTISDGLCEPIELTFELHEPLPITIIEVVASHEDVECFGETTGVIEVAITQVSIAPFDYEIALEDGTVIEIVTDTNAENYVFDNLAAGTYNITVTDANGTSQTLNGIVITQPAEALAITNAVVSDFNGFGISCNGEGDGSIDITIAGGIPPYTYEWIGPDGFDAATQDIAGLEPGSYTVAVTDTAGLCPATATYVITEPEPVIITAVTISDYNGFGISCFGENDGSIDITPSGGTGTYTYSWDGPGAFTATTPDLNNITAGTYVLTLTDSNGCTLETQTYTLTQPTEISVSQTHVNILCFGAETGSINITASGGNPIELEPGIFGYEYAWTGPDGFESSSEDLTDIGAGTYTVIVTDNFGCTETITVNVSQQSDIIITPTTTQISCYGADDASISVAISGGDAPYDVTWNTLATGTFQDNLGAGTYIITVTDDSGCQKSVTIVIPEAPVFTMEPTFSHVTCFGAQDGNITLNFEGGVLPVVLEWSDGSTAGTTRNNLGPGTYTATITEGTGCTLQQTFTILQPNAVSIGGDVDHATDCDETQGGSIDLHPAGGTPPYTFEWSTGDITEDLTGLTSGTYSVIVTDANGCTGTAEFTIIRPEPMSVSVTNTLDVECEEAYVMQVNQATASGGVPPYNYTWSTGTTSGTFNQQMVTDENGTVIVTATDSMGCTATTTFQVETEMLGDPSFMFDSYASATYNLYSIHDPIQFTNTSTGDFISVSWDFGDGSVSDEENPVHTYVREGIYIITQTVVYPYGCVRTNKITIKVEKGYEVMVPNAFTPNADGINDFFCPVFEGLRNIELNIYDTWGSMIYYEKGEVIKGWNGTLNNTPSENGNYMYKITAETFYGHIITYEAPFVLIK